MGRYTTRRSRDGESGSRRRSNRYGKRSDDKRSRNSRSKSPSAVESQFGYDHLTKEESRYVQRLSKRYGAENIRDWADEGMPLDAMGTPSEMEAFRERQAERPPEIPQDIERRNNRSIQRSKENATDHSRIGDTQVPDSVRDVISSSGRSLDASIQRVMEDRMGDSLGDVRIHTGHLASKACDEINARAFTVGNHVAFNTGEYDPESPEGQHVLAHELAHVRQQTGGAVSMLPQEGLDLEYLFTPSLTPV